MYIIYIFWNILGFIEINPENLINTLNPENNNDNYESFDIEGKLIVYTFIMFALQK